MRDNNFKKPASLVRRASDSSPDLQSLRQQLKDLKDELDSKKTEIFDINQKLRTEGLKNQKLKQEIVNIDEKCTQFTSAQIEYLYHQSTCFVMCR